MAVASSQDLQLQALLAHFVEERLLPALRDALEEPNLALSEVLARRRK